MDNLEFVQGLYNGKYCYSDSMTEEQIALLRIPSGVEDILRRMVAENRIIFLTGNPGDGKTYLIKAMPLRYNYDKPEKSRIARVFGYQARFFILFQTEKSSRKVAVP